MKNTLMKSLIIVLAMVLSWLQGGAQVINSIGDENNAPSQLLVGTSRHNRSSEGLIKHII